MHVAPLPPPVDPLRDLLTELAPLGGVEPDEPILASATRVGGTWMRRLELSLPAVGLQVRWLRVTPAELLEHARPDLPLVTWVEDPVGGRFVLVDGVRMGRLRARALGSGDRARWVDGASLLGPEPRTWARVVPTLPASPLGAQGPAGLAPRERVLRLLAAEREDVGVIVVYAVAVGFLSLATPLAIQLLINWLAFGALLQPILTLGGALLLCLTLAALLRAAQRHAVEIVQRRIFARVVADLSARLARARLEGFDKAYGPELANRFFDVLTLQKAANALLLDGLASALQAAVGLLVLALYHPYLLVFDVAVVALVIAVLWPFARGAEASALVESKKKYAVAAWLEELARHPLVFKMGGTRLAESRTDRLTEAYLGAREAHFGIFFRQFVGMQAVAVILPTALLVMAGWLVLEGQLTLGQLVAAEFIVASALAGLLKFTDKLETVYDLLAGADKLGHLFDMPVDPTHGAVREPQDSPAGVALHGVSFAFPGARTQGPFDLELEPGSSVGILGAPGSGKSTLAELVLGVRRPTSGTVLRDGMPAHTLRCSELFAEAALVRPMGLFNGTLRDNLTLDRPLPDAEVWRILEAVDLAGVVRALPDGLDSEVLPHGAPLSALQVRAVLLGRALAAEPRVLVVDGLLDGLPATIRERWLALVLDRRAPWTPIVFTTDPLVAQRCESTYELREGRLHARPRLTPL